MFLPHLRSMAPLPCGSVVPISDSAMCFCAVRTPITTSSTPPASVSGTAKAWMTCSTERTP